MSEIQVRPASASDRAAVLAFCQHTWDWGDYIEHVWDDWLHDSQGQLFVAHMDQQAVGMIHFHMASPDDAWLQGLRVDPSYRHLGIALALEQAATAEAIRKGATYLRLTVARDNVPSTHLVIDHQHMRPVGSFQYYKASPLPAQADRASIARPRIATIDDLDAIIEYLNSSNIFPLVGGLYYIHWVARPIEVNWLKERIQAQQVYLLQRWERIEGIAIAEKSDRHGEQALSVGYIDGTTIEAISFIAYDLRRRIAEMKLDHIAIYAPDLVIVRDAFDGAEYTPDSPVYISYERGLF